jgi:hypothetical protein
MFDAKRFRPKRRKPVRCYLWRQEGASWNQEASNIGDQRESQQTATMPDSDPAREVRFGIKTGAFYGQTLLANSDCLSAIKIKRILKYVTQTTTDQSDP